MSEILPVPNSIIQSTPTTKRIILIVALIVLSVGILLVFLSSNKTSQNYKTIFAENPPTANSELIYGSSAGTNLEPFSGKTVKAYKVPYTSEEIHFFSLIRTTGILIIIITLCFLAFKFGEFTQSKNQK